MENGFEKNSKMSPETKIHIQRELERYTFERYQNRVGLPYLKKCIQFFISRRSASFLIYSLRILFRQTNWLGDTGTKARDRWLNSNALRF